MTEHHRETGDPESAGLAAMLDRTVGETLTVANEFTEVTVRRVDTRNGSRLLITSPRTGHGSLSTRWKWRR